ncbi:MAG TPA: hypothetical protein VGM30_19870 [Puia sp.]|jgi:hypothetical protein
MNFYRHHWYYVGAGEVSPECEPVFVTNVFLAYPLVICLFCPIGICYFSLMDVAHLASTGDFIIGSVVALLAAFVTVVLPLRLMSSKGSRFPFSEAEMGGFGKTKVRAIRQS